MQEMSLSNTQAFHPGEYRHGPVSLSDENAAVMLLYSETTRDEEEKIQKELSAKGAFVCGIGGPGDLSFPSRPARTGGRLKCCRCCSCSVNVWPRPNRSTPLRRVT